MSGPANAEMTLRATRSESFESIPEVDFVRDMISEEIAAMENSLVSEFKLKEKNGDLLPEPLLNEDKCRFVLFPIQHHDVSERKFKFQIF